MSVSDRDLERMRERVERESFYLKVNPADLPQSATPGRELRILETNGKGLKVIVVPSSAE